MNIAGTCAVNCTVDDTTPFDLVTVAWGARPLHQFVLVRSCALKMANASATPDGILPSFCMVIAAATAGDDFATAPTLAASAAAMSWLR